MKDCFSLNTFQLKVKTRGPWTAPWPGPGPGRAGAELLAAAGVSRIKMADTSEPTDS